MMLTLVIATLISQRPVITAIFRAKPQAQIETKDMFAEI
jgi:hypothetical protein